MTTRQVPRPGSAEPSTVLAVARDFLTRARRTPAEAVRVFLGETIWHWDLASMSPVHRRAVIGLRMLYLVGRGFVSARAQQQAMALTYTTMLALVPAFAIIVALFSFRGLEGAQMRLQGFIVSALSASSQQEQQIIQWLNDLVDNMQGSGGVAGAAFFVFLFFTIVSLLSTLEKALNDIWGVKRGRAFINKFVTYWCIATLGPLFLGMALVQGSNLGQTVTDWSDWGSSVISGAEEPGRSEADGPDIGLAFPGVAGEFAREFEEVESQQPEEGTEGNDSLDRITLGVKTAGADYTSPFISLGLTIITFTLLYALFPNTRVRMKPALIGALTAAVLWAGTKWALALSSSTLVRYDAVYGSLATIPITMFWLYLTWLIVILGAEVSFAVQNIKSQRREELSGETTQVFKELVALRLMAAICVAFESGQPPPDMEALEERSGAPVSLCTSLLYHLSEDGLLREVELSSGGVGFVPARPMDRITVDDVVASLRERSGIAFELPEGEDLVLLHEHLDKANDAAKAFSGRVSLHQLAEALLNGGALEPGQAPVSVATKSAILRVETADLRAAALRPFGGKTGKAAPTETSAEEAAPEGEETGATETENADPDGDAAESAEPGQDPALAPTSADGEAG